MSKFWKLLLKDCRHPSSLPLLSSSFSYLEQGCDTDCEDEGHGSGTVEWKAGKKLEPQELHRVGHPH